MPKVTIYTTNACVYCQRVKHFFKEHDVVFEEKNVAVDAKAREEMIEKSGQLGVPVIEIGNDIIIGFNQPVLSELLGIK